MASPKPGQSRGYVEMVDWVIDAAFQLACFHNCKVYLLVESEDGIRTFSSYEDQSWPPPDHLLESYNSHVQRCYSYHMIHDRATEEDRKDIIQLLVSFAYLASRWLPSQGIPHQEGRIGERVDVSRIGWFGCQDEDEEEVLEEWLNTSGPDEALDDRS